MKPEQLSDTFVGYVWTEDLKEGKLYHGKATTFTYKKEGHRIYYQDHKSFAWKECHPHERSMFKALPDQPDPTRSVDLDQSAST